VLNEATEEPVSFANVAVVNSTHGAACDENGIFRLALPPGEYKLQVTAIGFRMITCNVVVRKEKSQPVRITMMPVVIDLAEEIVVYGENELDKIDGWLNSTDDILHQAEGVSMMRRANFALEPSIRGLSAGQIGIVIDGMKIFSACVDRMDPVTSYVEVENLAKLNVSKGSFDLLASQSVGGVIDMVTRKPSFDRPILLQAEAGVESASRLRRVRGEINYTKSSLAMRGTFSVKGADDFYAGGGLRIANSGFRKNNYKVDVSNRFNDSHTVEFSFIGDNARDIGYPVLLMDATKTESRIYRLEHIWKRPFFNFRSLNSKVYFNSIDHWMDDYNRDVAKRSVMPNMYMPMFGKTRTFGLVEKMTMYNGSHRFNFVLDFYRLSAFADMKMISIFPGVSEAYMLNIGDALVHNAAAALDYHWIISPKLRWRMNMRLDYSNRDVVNDFGRRQLEAFWDAKDIHRNYWAHGISSVFAYEIGNNNILQLAFAQSERMPSHIENYGFYLYNYIDGYFYVGNPQLSPEQSRQVEMTFENSRSVVNFRCTIFYNQLHNYISGLLQSHELKIYTNISSAYLTGAEMKGVVGIGKSIKLNASAAYVYGYNQELSEPLPLIPPLEGTLGVQYVREKSWFSVDSRFAAAQKRTALKTTSEDVTDAFLIFNVRGRVQFWNVWEVKFGIENIFDRLYHEHLSINNLPSRGRNVYLGLHYRLGK